MKKTSATPFWIILPATVILLALMVLGMRYPVVGRSDTIANVPNGLLLCAALLAALIAVACVVPAKAEFKDRKSLLSALCGIFFGGTIMLVGTLFLINGAFDRSAPQNYQTYLLDKYVHQARGTDYVLIVRDWHNPAANIRLRVDSNTYQLFSPSAQPMVNVTTAKGFLGFERIVRVQ